MSIAFTDAFRSGSDPDTSKHPLIKRILARLRIRQSVIVVGERLDGRSLLLQSVVDPGVMAEHKLNEFLVAGVTGVDIQEANPEKFWREMILPQLRAEAKRSGAGGLEESLHQCNSSDLPTDIDETFYAIRRAKRTPLIVWDEFERVTGNKTFDQGFFAHLRALSQMYEVTFLIGSTKPFAAFDLWTVNTSPFFNIFYTIDLDRIELAS